MNTFILALFLQNHKLKSTTLYQLLIGRRTTSVLSYAFFNDLLPYFGSFPKLTEKELTLHLKQLEAEKKIECVSSQSNYWQLITEDSIETPTFIQTIDYYRYGKKESEVWRLIQFLVQVASYLGKSKHYLPIENSPYYLAKTRQFVSNHKSELNQRIFEELSCLFSALSQENADFLARSLIGFQQNGAAFFQLLPNEVQEFPWNQLYLSAMRHRFFTELELHPDFLLYQFVQPILLANANQSAQLSQEMFLAGNSVEEICHKRHIRPGTLHDHLIEWAFVDPRFPFEQLISAEAFEQFRHLPADSWNYSYKELLGESDFSFFELRLYQIKQKRGL